MTCWSCVFVEILDDGHRECTKLLDMPVSADDCPSFCYEPGSDEERGALREVVG